MSWERIKAFRKRLERAKIAVENETREFMRMLRRQKWKMLGVALLILSLSGYAILQSELYAPYPRYNKLDMLVRFMAKAYCSCHFIMQQSDDYCREYVTEKVPLLGTTIASTTMARIRVVKTDGKDGYIRLVKVTALGISEARAADLGRRGCRLLP